MKAAHIPPQYHHGEVQQPNPSHAQQLLKAAANWFVAGAVLTGAAEGLATFGQIHLLHNHDTLSFDQATEIAAVGGAALLTMAGVEASFTGSVNWLRSRAANRRELKRKRNAQLTADKYLESLKRAAYERRAASWPEFYK